MEFEYKRTICWAAKKGYSTVVKLLIENTEVGAAMFDEALASAAEYGHLQIVELLLENHADPAYRDNNALLGATVIGHLQIVELLLKFPQVDPSQTIQPAIVVAADVGHTEIVRLLLNHPKIDPSIANNSAIWVAVDRNHPDIVRMLLDHPKMRWDTGDWSKMPREYKEEIAIRRMTYARKRQALRTIVRFIHDKFGNVSNLRHHIWKPDGYLSRKLALSLQQASSPDHR